MDKRRNLLVTLADKHYVSQAKQLFSSVYWNAGWKGDLMLLSHDIPDSDLKWFTDKNILVKKCNPISDKRIGLNYHPAVLDKFYLFTEEFKKWKNIIFLDSDIIVRSSIDYLTQVKSIGAVRDVNLSKLGSHFFDLPKNQSGTCIYDMKTSAFNSGVISFNTDIITPETFNELCSLFNEHSGNSKYGEQPVLNLYFYKKWEHLPLIYNLFIISFNLKLPRRFKSIIIHFLHGKDHPALWDTANPFYAEWKTNLEKADLIDPGKIQKSKHLNTFQITFYSVLLKIMSYIRIRQFIYSAYRGSGIFKAFIINIINTPNRLIGIIGNHLKRNNSDLYYRLKKIKDGK
ncbi:MAG TPA: glycosyltransferase [Bacteroidales bacterium]|nr:glycosyltransferase [Bacteroidales bacterium]